MNTELKEKVIERLDKAILDYIGKNTDTMDRFMYRLEVYSSFRNELDKNEYLIPQLKVLYGCNDLLVAIRTSVLRNTNGVVDPSYDELVSNFVAELYLEQRTKELISRVEKEQEEIQSEIQEKLPQEVVDAMHPDVVPVYWDYYSKDEKHYSDMIKNHKQISKNVWFAGGAWGWHGFTPFNGHTLETSIPALDACKNQNIKKMLLNFAYF